MVSAKECVSCQTTFTAKQDKGERDQGPGVMMTDLGN